MFISIVIGLFFLAFLLSLRSLRAELKKNIKTHEVAASLAKGRVLFIAESGKNNDHPQQPAHPQSTTPETVFHEDHEQQQTPAAYNQQPRTIAGIRNELSGFHTEGQQEESNV